MINVDMNSIFVNNAQMRMFLSNSAKTNIDFYEYAKHITSPKFLSLYE